MMEVFLSFGIVVRKDLLTPAAVIALADRMQHRVQGMDSAATNLGELAKSDVPPLCWIALRTKRNAADVSPFRICVLQSNGTFI